MSIIDFIFKRRDVMENAEFIPLPAQPVDLTEIRAKLWADVYCNTDVMLGFDPQSQADKAIKAFDKRFKNKAL